MDKKIESKNKISFGIKMYSLYTSFVMENIMKIQSKFNITMSYDRISIRSRTSKES